MAGNAPYSVEMGFQKLYRLKSFWNVKDGDTALNGTLISELRSVTCRIGAQSVTCHSAQVNAPRLTNIRLVCLS